MTTSFPTEDDSNAGSVWCTDRADETAIKRTEFSVAQKPLFSRESFRRDSCARENHAARSHPEAIETQLRLPNGKHGFFFTPFEWSVPPLRGGSRFLHTLRVFSATFSGRVPVCPISRKASVCAEAADEPSQKQIYPLVSEGTKNHGGRIESGSAGGKSPVRKLRQHPFPVGPRPETASADGAKADGPMVNRLDIVRHRF